jgi:glycosyltransferase involved in cell wall biosynthesis
MHIGLNAHLLFLGKGYRGAGASSYILNLLQRLPEAANGDHFTVFLSDCRAAESLRGLVVRRSRLPTEWPWVRIAWEQFIQPIELSRAGVNLAHAMAFVAPLLAPCPTVVTIYDLSPFHFPEGFRAWNRIYLRSLIPISVRRARRVIAISQCTKADIVQQCGVSPDKIDVVYCGINESFRPIADLQAMAEFRRSRSLSERLILFVGTIEPRKNLVRLVQAYAALRRAVPDTPPLVIAGDKGWLWQPVFAEVAKQGLSDHVLFPGYVDPEELPWWYNAAELLVYPSLYEGFGLPPLEAMACGTPVVTSNASSLTEVVGDAGLMIDPGDVTGLAEAMRQALRDPGLRESMRTKGLARAAPFSWLRAARETVAVYHRAVTSEKVVP